MVDNVDHLLPKRIRVALTSLVEKGQLPSRGLFLQEPSNFCSGKTALLWTLDKAPWAGLAISPDGRSLIYSQNDQWEFDVISVKNFH